MALDALLSLVGCSFDSAWQVRERSIMTLYPLTSIKLCLQDAHSNEPRVSTPLDVVVTHNSLAPGPKT